MRLYSVTLAGAALALGTVTSAAAMTTTAPSGLRGAIADTANVETVHCVPGWVHGHRWGWGTGCGYYRPRFYGYYHYRPRFYGYGFYRPRFHIGPRFYGHHRFYGRRW
jgi:hypothetical protein